MMSKRISIYERRLNQIKEFGFDVGGQMIMCETLNQAG